MPNFVYVDNSNVWIEGMHVSAVVSGHVPDIWTAIQQKICDYNWKMDFGKLFNFAGGAPIDVGRAVLFGSRPPKNDSLWVAAEKMGFEVVVQDRNASNREKRIDTGIVTELVADCYEFMKPESDIITLVAGDGDYVPTIERVRKRGMRFDVVFWDHASRDLKNAATNFISLNPYLEYLRIK
jgi:uncharacterized LabA/DUF88 family protein